MRGTERSRVTASSNHRAVPLQALSVLVVLATMWLLHSQGHSPIVAAPIGIAVYASINLAIWQIARRQSAQRVERQRENLEADIDEQRSHLYGGDP